MFRTSRWSSAFVRTQRRRTPFRSRRSVVALLVASLRSDRTWPHQGHSSRPQYGLESRPTLGWAGSPQETFPHTRAPQCCVASARVEAGLRTGGCLCGAVRYSVRGDPVHVRRCHCTNCRKESGSAFTVYAHWPVEAFEMSGEISSYDGRGFCPRCGSRVLDTTDRSDALIEIRIGSLDEAP